MIALEALHKKMKPLVLKVFWNKTKIEMFKSLLGITAWHPCGSNIEILEVFTYLNHNSGGSQKEDI